MVVRVILVLEKFAWVRFWPNPSLEMGQWIEDPNFSLYYVVVGLYTDYIDRWQKIVQLLYTKLQDQGHSRGIVRSFWFNYVSIVSWSEFEIQEPNIFLGLEYPACKGPKWAWLSTLGNDIRIRQFDILLPTDSPSCACALIAPLWVNCCAHYTKFIIST